MAAFQEHINIAVLSVGMLIVPFHSMGLLDIEQSLVALFFGVLGGIFPDLDSDTSKPIQGVFKILSITLPLIFILSFKTTFSIIEMLEIWAVTTLVLRLVFFNLFVSMTQHRGIFHSIPMGILFAQLVVILCLKLFKIDIEISFLYGFFMFFGFFIHLLLDELYSVNALGIKVKKSFGTALKLYDSNNKSGTLILYILITLLWFNLPKPTLLFSSIQEAFHTIKFY